MHKTVVAFRMLFRQADIFVHIEGDHMLKADLTRFMHLNQRFIGRQRRAAGRQTQDKRAIGGRFERINTFNDVTSGPFANLFCGTQGDQSHSSPQ